MRHIIAEKLHCSFYKYDKNYFAILPYLDLAYHKSQGETSIGCIKMQLQFGWLIFGGMIFTKHEYPIKFNLEGGLKLIRWVDKVHITPT